jgi:hypothetical protein
VILFPREGSRKTNCLIDFSRCAREDGEYRLFESGSSRSLPGQARRHRAVVSATPRNVTLKHVNFRRERRVLPGIVPPVQSAALRAGLPRLPPRTQSAKTSNPVTKVARLSCWLLQITSYQLYALETPRLHDNCRKRRILWPNEGSQVTNSGCAFKPIVVTNDE